LFGAQFPLFDAGVPFLVEAFDLTVELVFLEFDPDLGLFSEEVVELVDLSLSWLFVVSWVLAQDDLFETDQSFTAPFVDLSVPLGVSQDELSVVTFVLLVDFVDVELVWEETSNDLFFFAGLEASVTAVAPVGLESTDTAKSEFGGWGAWQTDT